MKSCVHYTGNTHTCNKNVYVTQECRLTKFIHLFAFILKLLYEICHFALFRESCAVLHKAYVNIHSSCNNLNVYTYIFTSTGRLHIQYTSMSMAVCRKKYYTTAFNVFMTLDLNGHLEKNLHSRHFISTLHTLTISLHNWLGYIPH